MPHDTPPPQEPAGESAGVRRAWFGGRTRAAVGEPVKAEPAPPPPERRKKSRKSGLIAVFSGLLTLALVLTLALGGVFMVGRQHLEVPGPLALDKSVIIERGTSTEEIVELLEREGVIARPTLFWAALILREIQSKIAPDEATKNRAKFGEYLFRKQVSMAEVLDIITSGRAVEHSITIPEGLTSEQIVEKLKENPLLTGEVADIPAEGALLPDTYKISRGTAREALLARMMREQKRVLDDIWKRRAKDIVLKSPRELVTLASIVEKETGRADERNRVAGVFYNRLDKKMKLQSDPTIIYGIVGGKGTLGRPISRADIDKPTAYNTYTIPALPPGPIANPGRAAMEAVANPSRTRDLFFVADGTGGHAFAETLEQHNRNVARWRQIEAARPAGNALPQDGGREASTTGQLAAPAP